MVTFFQRYGLYLAWVVACAALLGSLYSSELALLPVCKLCWFQRIALYPLALILGIAAYYDDRQVYRYALPLAGIGIAIALYHYLLQQFPTWFPLHLCDLGPSCYQPHIQWLGVITYPALSLLSSCAIFALVWLARPRQKR